MTYIRFMNEVQEFVPRTYIEKMGLSTKRDDPNSIGQFGSGSSLAPIAALRNGWEWVSVCEDQFGPYQMSYVAEEGEDGFTHVFYDYGSEKKPSSFTIDAGVLSWDDPFQIFREAFANAIDENITNGAAYSVDIVDEIENVPGHFCVYVTADPQLTQFLYNFDKWFCLKRKPFASGDGWRAFENLGESCYDVYQKGIRIGGDNKITAFSWELDKIALNEERRIKNEYLVNDTIQKILKTTDNVDMIEKVLRLATLGSFSASPECGTWEIGSYEKVSSAWKHAWNRLYTGLIPVSPEEADSLKANLRIHNMDVKIIPSSWIRSILVAAGVGTPQEILGQDAEFDYIEMTSEVRGWLQESCDLMSASGTYDYDQMRLVNKLAGSCKLFTPKNNQEMVLGVYSQEYKNVSMSSRCSSLHRFLATWIHECDHAISKLGDNNEFRIIADDRIATLMIAMGNREVRISS